MDEIMRICQEALIKEGYDILDSSLVYQRILIGTDNGIVKIEFNETE